MSVTTTLIVFGFITLAMLGLEIMYTYATRGFAYGFSSNRASAERTPLGLRIQRAYQNQIEAAAYAVPVFGAAAITGLQGNAVELAALLFIVGRAAFAVLYYSGIPFIRVPAFLLGTLSTLFVAVSLIASGMM